MLPHEAVLAGSPEFVDALLPLVTGHLGGPPRVADSPSVASALCQDGAHLLVYEHAGREWLSLCEQLRGLADPGLVVVAALPPEHAADVAEISGAASAVVAWRGDGRPVMDALARVMAARETPQPAPPRRTGPVLTPQPRPAVAAPTPPRPRPVPPAATPRPRPTMSPTPRPAPVPAPTPAPVAPPPAGDEPFEAIFEEEAAADAATPSPEPLGAPEPIPPPPVHSSVWPGTVLSAADGLAVVRAALSGLWPEQRLRPVTERLVASLSTAEKAAAVGQKLPFDAAPVRRAVGLRWQVAAAIDTLPPLGAQIDQVAVQDILVGIDEVLAEMKVESEDVAPEVLRALESIRHALVKEAIDLTEALQQVAPADVVEEITTSRKARRSAPAPVTRVVRPQVEPEREPSHVPWGMVVVLVLAVIAAAAYHGFRYVNRSRPAAPAVAGAPAGTVGAVIPQGKVVVAPNGKKLDPKEVENFKNLEKAKGNEVREVSPGTFIVTPARAPSPPAAGSSAAPTQGAKP